MKSCSIATIPGDGYRARGEMMPADGYDALRAKHAIVPGIDAPLRRRAPGDLDGVIVGENSEGENPAAARLRSAIEALTANPALHTRGPGGNASTAQVTDAVCRLLER